jgi:hypothetical protein
MPRREVRPCCNGRLSRDYWFRCPHGSNKTTPTTSAIAPMARRRADRPIVPTKAPTTTGTAIEITAPHDQRHGEAGPSCWCSPWARPPDRPHDAAPLEPGREPELTQPGRQRWRVRRQVATEHEDFEDREAERRVGRAGRGAVRRIRTCSACRACRTSCPCRARRGSRR